MTRGRTSDDGNRRGESPSLSGALLVGRHGSWLDLRGGRDRRGLLPCRRRPPDVRHDRLCVLGRAGARHRRRGPDAVPGAAHLSGAVHRTRDWSRPCGGAPHPHRQGRHHCDGESRGDHQLHERVLRGREPPHPVDKLLHQSLVPRLRADRARGGATRIGTRCTC